MDVNGQIGQRLVLRGDGGCAMAVTVHDLVDPFPVSGMDAETPAPGHHYVAVRATVENLGAITIEWPTIFGLTGPSGSPGADAVLESRFSSPSSSSDSFGYSLPIGATQDGCMAADVPDGARVDGVNALITLGTAHFTPPGAEARAHFDGAT